MDLIFATNNKHKLSEISDILNSKFNILSLKDIGFNQDIPETQNTIEGNALQKAHFIHDRYSQNCFADDTGLEVEALNGQPGVYSARYAGVEQDFNKNIDKLLNELQDIENRKAAFKTVIALIYNEQEFLFEGIIHGIITNKRRGSKGFGYDPVFMPDGYDETFAEMNSSKKNSISHRALATFKLANFLKHL